MTRSLLHTTVGDRQLNVVATDRGDGDVHPGHVEADALRRTQQRATGRAWAMVDQVHGIEVRSVGGDGGDVSTLARADVLTTDAVDISIAVWAADCAPVVLAADDGTLVVAHAGWRGLANGVIDVAVDAATASGGRVAAAVLGPVIHPCCYAFDMSELATVPHAEEALTHDGRLALDVPATVASQLREHDVVLDVEGPCTGCDSRWFSHRVRKDPQRHAVVAWWEAAA